MDPPDQENTAKERDAKSELDDFGARYYSGAQGTFTSSDNFLNDTSARDPQSWDFYIYVHNNPLRYVDPNGEKIYVGELLQDDQDELLGENRGHPLKGFVK